MKKLSDSEFAAKKQALIAELVALGAVVDGDKVWIKATGPSLSPMGKGKLNNFSNPQDYDPKKLNRGPTDIGGKPIPPPKAATLAKKDDQFVTVYCDKAVNDVLLTAIEKDYPHEVARVDDKSFNMYWDTGNVEKANELIWEALSKHLTPAGIEVDELAP